VSVEFVEFLVEDLSTDRFLLAVAPKLLGETRFAIHSFQGKRDLLSKLPDRLCGYSKWLPQHYRIVIVVDRDSEDCKNLLDVFDAAVERAGLKVRKRSTKGNFQVVTRIAIEELEAWYFGDWAAVAAVYPRAAAAVRKNTLRRKPNEIKGAWEAFERTLQKFGYFKSGLNKIEAAEAIGPNIDPARNTSPSFQALARVLSEMRT
jgi:hypothetical protein